MVKSGVFDGQGQDEASEEHEVGRLQVVDAHFGLKKSFFIKLCLLSIFFLAQIRYFYLLCFNFSFFQVRRNRAILERLVLKRKTHTTLCPR